MERVKSVCYNRIFTSLDLKLLKPNSNYSAFYLANSGYLPPNNNSKAKLGDIDCFLHVPI